MEKLLSIKIHAKAVFKKRINKYLGEGDIFEPFKKAGELVHIHDPGRLVDLLYPSKIVSLAHNPKETRKTEWDVLFSYGKNGEEILINTMFHSKIAKKILQKKHKDLFNCKSLLIQAEKRYLNKRFDFFVETENEKKYWCEIKGVTKRVGNIAVFPDAPTKRGREHLEHLSEIVKKGEHGCVVIFLVFQNGVSSFTADSQMDHLFANAFNNALEDGVKCFAPIIESKNGELFFKRFIPVKKSPFK